MEKLYYEKIKQKEKLKKEKIQLTLLKRQRATMFKHLKHANSSLVAPEDSWTMHTAPNGKPYWTNEEIGSSVWVEPLEVLEARERDEVDLKMGFPVISTKRLYIDRHQYVRARPPAPTVFGQIRSRNKSAKKKGYYDQLEEQEEQEEQEEEEQKILLSKNEIASIIFEFQKRAYHGDKEDALSYLNRQFTRTRVEANPLLGRKKNDCLLWMYGKEHLPSNSNNDNNNDNDNDDNDVLMQKRRTLRLKRYLKYDQKIWGKWMSTKRVGPDESKREKGLIMFDSLVKNNKTNTMQWNLRLGASTSKNEAYHILSKMKASNTDIAPNIYTFAALLPFAHNAEERYDMIVREMMVECQLMPDVLIWELWVRQLVVEGNHEEANKAAYVMGPNYNVEPNDKMRKWLNKPAKELKGVRVSFLLRMLSQNTTDSLTKGLHLIENLAANHRLDQVSELLLPRFEDAMTLHLSGLNEKETKYTLGDRAWCWISDHWDKNKMATPRWRVQQNREERLQEWNESTTIRRGSQKRIVRRTSRLGRQNQLQADLDESSVVVVVDDERVVVVEDDDVGRMEDHDDDDNDEMDDENREVETTRSSGATSGGVFVTPSGGLLDFAPSLLVEENVVGPADLMDPEDDD